MKVYCPTCGTSTEHTALPPPISGSSTRWQCIICKRVQYISRSEMSRHKSNQETPQRSGKEPEQLLTVQEVARQLRVDDTTVRKWIKAGVLEAVTLPNRGIRHAYRIKESALRAILERRTP